MKKGIKIIVLTIIITLVCHVLGDEINEKVTLTQLSAQTNVRMMGYIIRTENKKMIVIDGGLPGDTANLMKYIAENNNKVDYWFLTHLHNDHVGAFTEIVNNENVEIDNIYVSYNDKQWYEEYESERAEFSKYVIDILNSEKIKKKVICPSLNEKFEIDGIDVEILGIRNPEITENAGNGQSMVIKFSTQETSLLILGDTEINSSAKLLENQKDKLKSDIVQISHHGQDGATKQLYEAIAPSVCLWPTTEYLWNNDIGLGENSGPWKTFETRQWIKELGVTKNYVAKDGDITITIK